MAKHGQKPCLGGRDGSCSIFPSFTPAESLFSWLADRCHLLCSHLPVGFSYTRKPRAGIGHRYGSSCSSGKTKAELLLVALFVLGA